MLQRKKIVFELFACTYLHHFCTSVGKQHYFIKAYFQSKHNHENTDVKKKNTPFKVYLTQKPTCKNITMINQEKKVLFHSILLGEHFK